MTTNCIKFTSADIETAKGVGSISTLTFDLDIVPRQRLWHRFEVVI